MILVVLLLVSLVIFVAIVHHPSVSDASALPSLGLHGPGPIHGAEGYGEGDYAEYAPAACFGARGGLCDKTPGDVYTTLDGKTAAIVARAEARAAKHRAEAQAANDRAEAQRAHMARAAEEKRAAEVWSAAAWVTQADRDASQDVNAAQESVDAKIAQARAIEKDREVAAAAEVAAETARVNRYAEAAEVARKGREEAGDAAIATIAAQNTNAANDSISLAKATALNIVNTDADVRRQAEYDAGKYLTSSLRDNACVDVYNSAPRGIALPTVRLWDKINGGNQKWKYDAARRLVNVESGMCMDVSGASTVNGAPIIQHPCHDGANQKWTFQPDGTLRPDHDPGKCLDVNAWIKNNGAGIISWACHAGANQRWTYSSQAAREGSAPSADRQAAERAAKRGRYVSISSADFGGCYNIGEIEVYDVDGVNVARDKNATMSTTYGSGLYLPSAAVDGDPNTFAHNNCEHWKSTWLEIDLGTEYLISKIDIFNRKGDDEIRKRINGSTVVIYDGQRTLRWKSGVFGGSKESYLFEFK